MAGTGRIIFSSYQFSGSSDQNSTLMGRSHNFPGAQTAISAAPVGTLGGPNNNITLLSIVTILPSGLQNNFRRYYSPADVATIQTAST